MQNGDSVTGNLHPHQYFADSTREGVDEGTVYVGGTGELPGYASWIIPIDTEEKSFSLEMDMKVKSLMIPASNDIWSGIVVVVNMPAGNTIYFSFHGIEENEEGTNARIMVMKNSRSEEGAYSQDFILPADGNFHKWIIMYDGQSEVRFFIDQRQFNWATFVSSYLNYDSEVWWEYVEKRLRELNIPEEKWPENFLDKVDKNGNRLNYDDLALDIDKLAFSNILAINEYGAPHEFLSDYVKENNYGEFYVSHRMSAYYTGIWEHMNSTFFYLHPEWKRGGSYQFSYIHEEYRSYLHDLLMELASYENVDGITMDFGRYYYVFGTELTDVAERTKIMNDFVKSIHDDLPEGKILNVRVLKPTADKAAAWGLDYQTWVKNGWVDRVIISDQSMETFFDMTPYANFFSQHEDVEFYLGINATISGHDMTKEEENILKAGGTIQRGERVSKEQILLRAYEAYMAGADGIFFFNGLGTDPVYTNLNNKTLMEKWYEYQYPASLISYAVSTPSAHRGASASEAAVTVEARAQVLPLPVSLKDWEAATTIEDSGKADKYQSHGKEARVSYAYDENSGTLMMDVDYNLNSWLYDLVLTDADGKKIPFKTERKYGGYNEGDTLWGSSYEANGHADAISVLSLTVENVKKLPDRLILFASNCGTSTEYTAKLTIQFTADAAESSSAAPAETTTAAPDTPAAAVPVMETERADSTPVPFVIGGVIVIVIVIAAAAILLRKKKKS